MRFSELEGRRIGVWGAGAETRSFAHHVARALPRARIAVVVLEEVADAPELTEGADVVDAARAVPALSGCDVLVRSPGVSLHRPELRELAARGLPIATPTALWMAERGGRNVLGITATKGKSTTATLVAHLAQAAGVPAQLAGNIGRPALDLLEEDEAELAVVELSSYQTADLTVGPEVAMASNLYREHLNWHVTEEAYRREKLRLLALPGVRRCVLNATSPEVMAAPRACAEAFTFGTPEGWHVMEGGVAHRGELVVAAEDLPLEGPHNALNVCGALTALEALGIPLPALPGAFEGFSGLPHRLQRVHLAEGVTWIDDSISTVPQTAEFALDSFPGRPIVLIGGGTDRGQDYTALGERLAARQATVIALPDTGRRLLEAARAAGLPEERTILVDDLPAAVAAAHAAAVPGGVVLLSPAAPSFVQYLDFQQRGFHFQELSAATAQPGMRREEREGMAVLRFQSLPDDRLDAFVSTRVGGASEPPYASLNLGLRVGDDPDRVVANRRRLFAAFELPLERSVWCRQIHRDDVTVVEASDVAPRADGRRDRGAFDEATIVTDTDALVTGLTGVPLCVTLADCVPVVIYDPVHHAVGLAHAGWGGTVARIASGTVATMRERYGSDPAALVAAIGPSIAPARYVVGRDVIEKARAAYGDAPVLREISGGKALFDLWEANALDLEGAGVPRASVEIAGISTIDALDTFYSHRAERVTGRFIAAVTLRPVSGT